MSTRETPYTKSDYISSKSIMRYMQANIDDHIDPLTGLVNATTLAEDACSHFDGYDGNEGDNIPDKFFELADLTAMRYEINAGIIEPPIYRSLGWLINSKGSDSF